MSIATQKSMDYLKKLGWTVALVERFIPKHPGMKFPRRIDVYGFGDLLGCRARKIPGNGDVGEIALFQCGMGQHHEDHRTKILALPGYRKWKAAEGWVILHSWALKPKGGIRGAKKVWMLKEEIL